VLILIQSVGDRANIKPAALSASVRIMSADIPTFAVGATGFVIASQLAMRPSRHPIPFPPQNDAAIAHGHDLVGNMTRGQLATERDRYKERRTAINTAHNPRQGDRAPSTVRGRGKDEKLPLDRRVVLEFATAAEKICYWAWPTVSATTAPRAPRGFSPCTVES
jgi:hypothetical protein